jgi:hypothetical protein
MYAYSWRTLRVNFYIEPFFFVEELPGSSRFLFYAAFSDVALNVMHFLRALEQERSRAEL